MIWECNNITETRFHNIIVEKGGVWYTPQIADGVLGGVARGVMLSCGEVFSKSISLSELKSADSVYIMNSVRGVIPAYLEF